MQNKSLSVHTIAAVDALEPRRLFAGQINFANFASTEHLVDNGFGSDAVTSSDNRLRLTDGRQWQARSVWYDMAVPIKKFVSHFSFQTDGRADSADGLTFAIQNSGTGALGALGQDLGYGGIDKSEAVTFNLYNRRAFGSKFDFTSDGERPQIVGAVAGLDLHNGHLFHVTVEYDGATLKTTVSDANDRSNAFTASKSVDLSAAVGDDTAYVGFTGGTGEFVATQDITSWSFAGSRSDKPTIAATGPLLDKVVTTNKTTLSALGEDDGGESSLSYAWSVIDQPAGSRDSVFSANGTNAAKSVTAQFFKEGLYTFRCTITDVEGQSTFTDVKVRVKPTPTRLLINEHGNTIDHGVALDYDAVVLNQFNRPLRQQPAVSFSAESIAGTIDDESGIFKASEDIRGHVLVKATSGNLVAFAGATVRP